MAEPGPKADDRRRNPRFSCGGRAVIHCLPFDGASISAALRDLSLGGICLDVAEPVAVGARAEIVVSVNAASFRAAALVKGQRANSGTCLQFLQMSTRGQDILAELLETLARLQALNKRLRSSRIDEETERILRREGGFRLSSARGVASSCEDEGESAAVAKSEAAILDADSRLIRIDFFG